MEELDTFDLAILNLLQKDNMRAQRDIGEEIGLSAAAVQRRVKRLKETRVIQSNVAVIDRAKVGRPISLFVEVTLDNERIELIDEAKESFKNAPEVQQCYYVTGEVDFVLIVLVTTMHDYELLTRRLFFSNSNIRNFKTFVAMDIVKCGLSVPLDR
ncbi:Lrp/AsnC family transcriptional regulator [Sphingobacterium sp. SYP-B4668]|uniref:Lrp/AsnC family transcriptional regulator n=1 Tax=Sphingobacterium sp. SYP-B4668 TaxID=2996035 RepID=UPI0022DDE503|nr:Lrp/AsnC family transcriptional regulator [Sphingobacterium sp. SYP-B4668]